MEHLGIPEEHRSRETIVPYLGIAPRYDKQGLIGFPERHGYRSEDLTRYSKESFFPNPRREDGADLPPFSQEFLESFFQEWLWFGMLHEFELLCGLPLDLDTFIRTGTNGQRSVNTDALLSYVKSVAINLLIRHDIPLDLKLGDWVYIKEFHEESSSGVPSTNAPSSGEGPANESIQLVPSRASSTDRDYENFPSRTSSPRYRPLSSPASTPDSVSERRPQQIMKCWGDLRYSFDEDEEEEYAWHANELEQIDAVDEPADLSDILARCENIPLQRLISLAKDVQADTKLQLKDRLSRFGQCLRLVRRTMWRALLPDHTALRLEIAFSIDVLLISLAEVVLNVLGEKLTVNYPSNGPYRTELGKRMKHSNWCLARTELVLSYSLVARYFKSTIPSYELNPHMDCTPMACFRQPRDVNSLHAQHDLELCDGSCQVLAFDEQKLIDILEADGIPGVCRTENDAGDLDFKVVDVTGRYYIAISHVWSHGLGNPSRNALPLCQVERLFKYIQATSSSEVILWIDTLSVPVDLQYKRLAITKLRTVYEKAHSVLVIDRHLIKVGKHLLERQIQVLCSEWMRRLWTLQEGRLAARLYVQFRHEAVQIQEISGTDAITTDNNVFEDVGQRAGRAIHHHFSKPSHITRRFVDLVLDMGHRSVTVAEDEPICLATMLGLPLEMFKPYPTMLDIYRSLPVLPPELLFLKGPKMNTPGFRWAPSTFLNQDPEGFEDSPNHDTASLMEGGLRIVKSCILLKNEIYFIGGVEYLVRGASDIEFVFYRNPPMPDEKSYSNAGIILNTLRSKFRTTLILAVFVDDINLRDGIYHCRFRKNLVVRRWNGLDHQGEEMVVTADDEERTFEGEFQEDVTFCVD